MICCCFFKSASHATWRSIFRSCRERSGLLEGELDPTQETLAAGGLTSGRKDAKRNVTAPRQLNGVGDIGGHEVICIAIAKLRLETCEELLLASLPGDVNFHASDLSSIRI